MHHVIVGAGPAGVTAAEILRQNDPQARITLVADQAQPPYSRMAIPYYLIGQVGESGTYLRQDPSHFEKRRIDVVRRRVSGIDVRANSLILASGKRSAKSLWLKTEADRLAYDKLLLATGSHPITPPIPGLDLPCVHNCWTLEDAEQITRLASQNARVVLIGAGFIGCIILEALALRGVQLTVVEMGDRMVPRMMNEKAGNLIKTWCIEKGVQIHTSTRVESIERDGEGARLHLTHGEQLPADLVITATGVATNMEFLNGSDIETDRGILVDRHLRTSSPDIYAAGDCAQGLDFSTGQNSVHAIQPTAADHGRTAALNMLGNDVLYQGSVNMNVLDTLGLVSSSFGLWMGVETGDHVERYEPERYRYLNLQFDTDCLVGATSIGWTEHVGVLRGMIQTRVRLGAWKERLRNDPTRLAEAAIACTQLA